eukprot:CAMPEP_0177781694 /NCGR_PEP_ID=MMETSP0491_2-20121128/18011_1 /TAXON_ID=63592 /ORGANISM="Tetraselmis chuii, Strain PLY429" /LENGTH=204 /DNA_ID=CAMNT_0019301825 /DNA_START=307 /DNA_END=921 /DNA_ORIENTATION=+
MASAQSYQPVSRDAIDSSLAQNLDFATLDDLDPSLADGFYVYYEREVPFELRSSEGSDLPSEVGALEAIRVKVLLLGDQNNPEALKVELSSESNLFFHYIHQMSPASFKELQEGQKLMVDFAEYPAVLLRMLNHCIKEPHSYLAVFVIIQNMEYKFVELLSCRFVASPDEVVRQHITYRYNAIKSRLALMQARLADVNALVSAQ